MNCSPDSIQFNFEHSFAVRLPEFCESVSPTPVCEPELLQFNQSLARELGLDPETLPGEVAARIFCGNELPGDARPIAQAYAGHQFGNFVPQLGDGRAIMLGELIDRQGVRRDIALKGSGRTPFSRSGDGRAAVGPVLREYLVSEAMHALGIPTTRALAAVATGETVMRERPLPGAVLTRVAASHVRVGTFQFFSARQQDEQVRKLADYVIERHFQKELGDFAGYWALLRAVMDRQAALVARWMLVGFIHGVMNTDNTSISGETIDYGPCAFMESYDPQSVFSSIDHAGRYAYANQPGITLWNLSRFAETLLPLLGEEGCEQTIAEATKILETFTASFQQHWYRGASTKLGLAGLDQSKDIGERGRELVDEWLELLRQNKADFTLAWRRLAEAAEDKPHQLQDMLGTQGELDAWLEKWRNAWNGASPAHVANAIRSANPLYIPRNHLVEEALAAANAGDLMPFENLLEVVQHPFDDKPRWARYAEPASARFTACYKTFCGT